MYMIYISGVCLYLLICRHYHMYLQTYTSISTLPMPQRTSGSLRAGLHQAWLLSAVGFDHRDVAPGVGRGTTGRANFFHWCLHLLGKTMEKLSRRLRPFQHGLHLLLCVPPFRDLVLCLLELLHALTYIVDEGILQHGALSIHV